MTLTAPAKSIGTPPTDTPLRLMKAVESRLDAIESEVATSLGSGWGIPSQTPTLIWGRRDEMEAKLSSLPMAERNMLARVMNDIDEDQVRHLHSTNLDSALRPI